MKGIEPYSREQLEDPTLLGEVDRKVKYYLRYDNGVPGEERVEFSKLRLRLEEGIRKYGSRINTKLRSRYIDLIIKLNFLQLNLLTEVKIVELFKKYFLRALLLEINIEEKLRAKTMSFPALYEIDPFMQDIKKALKENVETLGSERINVGSSDKLEKPYIKNWLLDYDNMVGAKSQGEIEISGYIFKSKNARKLSSEDKHLLKRILIFYEKLKLDFKHPNSIASLSLSLFGIKTIGTGLNRRFSPLDKNEYEKEIKKSSTKIGEAKKLKYEKRPSDLMPGPQSSGQINQPVAKVPSREKKKVISKNSIEYKKQKKYQNLKPIPKKAINKFSSSRELSKLTIQDLRSLGSDSKSAGEFLLNKIKKLSSFSPMDRESCKNFLRQSELYKIYLLQGREALDTKESMFRIAEKRKAEGKAYLNEEEFDVLRGVFKAI